MRPILKPKYATRYLTRDILFFVVVLIAYGAIAIQCKGEGMGGAETKAASPRSVVRDGFTIALLETPEAQLRHAQARFADPLEKKASLAVVIDQFPTAREVRASAEMELAYLTLGTDYRFATPEQCRMAIEAYRQVVVDHADLPAVCAKANWYIGWILADLLNERGEAATYFLAIIDTYPDAKLSLTPPVPWVSLVLPQSKDRPQTVYDRPTHFWGSLALLELIRIRDTEAEKWLAFTELYARYPTSLATAYAMRELLMGSSWLARKTVAYAKTHLTAMRFRRPLADEIPKLLHKVAAVQLHPSGDWIRGEE
jgi:hypothetical protein